MKNLIIAAAVLCISANAWCFEPDSKILSTWIEVLDKSSTQEDSSRVVTWRIGKSFISRMAKCTLDNHPVTLLAANRIKWENGAINLLESSSHQRSDIAGTTLCRSVLPKGLLTYTLDGETLTIKFAGAEPIKLVRDSNS